MNAVVRIAATVTPGKDNLDPTLVSPGIAGFLTVFALAIATILLVRSMVGHLRKVRYSPDPNAQGRDVDPSGGTSSHAPNA